MKPRLAIILLLIVLIPLGLMVWLGFRVARGEQAAHQESIRKLHIEKLKGIEGVIQKVVQKREREIQALAESLSTQPAALRKALRDNPALSQVFVLSKDGQLFYPDMNGPLSRPEEEFLTRAGQVWKDQAIFFRPGSESGQGSSKESGWYTWYWGSGIHFVFWQQRPDGRVIGFELSRYRLIADIISELPDSSPGESASGSLLAWLGARGETLYQWGPPDRQLEPGQQPLVSLAMQPPLSAWRLAVYPSGKESPAGLGPGILFNLIAALLVFGIALGVMAIYFYRESSRELREAGQRVSFVNHVSHELKTPLTNIRMYAELLQESLPPDDDKTARYLDVVVSESVRLSRLINNVLTFARQQRRALKIRTVPGVVDQVVEAVLESFQPSLQARGIQVKLEAGAPARVLVDADALGQILGNLLGNVEKYAPDSGELRIETSQEGASTVILVKDKGPGVPPGERENVFRPFVRLSSQVSDGVAGTGIGLSIARELARLHGGDLTLESGEGGATFKLTLSARPE